jgi:hypothetical protein
MTIGDGDILVFAIKFDEDDIYLACAYGDGMTRIYNSLTGKLSYSLQRMDGRDNLPVTCL